MRLLFAGTPEVSVIALQRLLDSEHEVVGVLTRPDARKGRGRTLLPSPVAALAEELGIPTLKPASLQADTEDGQEFRRELAKLNPDCIPVVAYGNLVPKDLLDAPAHGWVNLHFSLLPQWRGAAPVQSAIFAGDDITGATTFRIEEGLDTGPIFGTTTLKLTHTETAEELLTVLAHSGSDLLVATMDGLADGTVVAEPQQGEPTYAAKITKEDAQVNWALPARNIDRQIRAHTPAPGAWTVLGDQRFKLGPVTLCDDGDLAPGVVRVEKHGVYVGTATNNVQLGLIQPPGKKMMQATDWSRGAQTTEGMVFEHGA
ncbi:methionyl-tRNA formyltransferase [Staphylococcus chromogenes]|nr:methionyl-tRNA formyltransferase [Staphylococcus chromogenes]